jgi:SAM-dependent methyltransferase
MVEPTLETRTATPVVTAPSCRFCGGSRSMPSVTAWDRNRELSEERFVYWRCHNCATVFLASVPDDLGRYYGAGYHGFSGGEPQWRHSQTLRDFEAARVELIRRHAEPGPLIEIGSGAGAFAAAARDAGFAVTGIERDKACCDHLRDGLGVGAIHTDQPAAALADLGPPAVVAMWHVLEHLPDPDEALAAAAATLRPGGLLALGVPNPESLQFHALGARWAHLDAPRHLSLIPADALTARAAGLGLRRVALGTNDPFGLHCNQHGWTAALVSRPARGLPVPARCAGLALTRLMAPVERRGLRGSALLLVFGKPSG